MKNSSRPASCLELQSKAPPALPGMLTNKVLPLLGSDGMEASTRG
jgi:hypothetical protein